MRNFRLSGRAKGFSLIEVLIAVVILSIGLLALASLQLSLMRSSAESKAQTIALSLAQNQIENLRSFNSLATYRGYTDIAATDVSVGSMVFNIGTEITRYVYDSSAGTGGQYILVGDTASDTAIASNTCGAASGTAHTCISGRDFKRALVTVQWNQADGSTGRIGLEDAFSAINPSDSAKTVKSATANNTPRKAKVKIYNPGSTAGVIPIAIGTGTNTAATNPTPEVAGKNTSSERVVETRFNVLTYGAVSGNTAVATSRVETAVAGCTCKRIAPGTVKGFRPSYWDGDKYSVPEIAAFFTTGQVATGLTVPQSAQCTICCRDHHDNSTTNATRVSAGQPKFDPWRTTHDHYAPSLDSNGDLVMTATAVNSNYAESCRLIRVNGIFRVAADTFNESTNLLGAKNDGSATEYVPSDTYRDAYAGVLGTSDGAVKTYLNTRYVLGANGDYNGFSPNTSANSIANGVSSSTLHPTSISMTKSATDYRWLHARGLYIDYLEAAARTRLDDIKTACTSCTTAQKLEAVLTQLPFTSVNLSEISNWPTFDSTLLSNTTESADVIFVSTDEFVNADDSATDAPIRGLTSVGVKPGGGTPTPRAEAQIFRSNSGIALLELPIDPSEVTPGRDAQNFSLSGSTNSIGGYYRVAFTGYTFASSTASYPRISTSVPTSRCTYNVKGSQRGRYTCINYNLPIPSGSNSILTVKLGRYNYQDSSRTSTAAMTCKGPDNVTTRPYEGPAYAVNYCKNFAVTGVTSSASGVTFTSPVVAFDGNIGESTTFTLNKLNDSGTVNSSDLLTVTMTGPTETMTQSTCTYAESTINATTTYTYFPSPTPCP